MKKEIKTEIDEAIADAIAEEEVKKEQPAEEPKTYDFRDELEAHLKDAFSESILEKHGTRIKIDLDEYITLKLKAIDLDRIMNAIIDELGLSYSKEYLTLKDSSRITETIRALYPDMYDNVLAIELAQADNEG